MIEILSKSKWVKILPIWIKYGNIISKLPYNKKIIFEAGVVDSFEIIIFGKSKKTQIGDSAPKLYQINFNERFLLIIFVVVLCSLLSVLLQILEKKPLYSAVSVLFIVIIFIQQFTIGAISLKNNNETDALYEHT